MNKISAIRIMLAGGKVTHIAWNPKEFIYFSLEEGFCNFEFDQFDTNHMLTEGWRTYEPPVQKVKMWQWVLRNEGVVDKSPFAENELAAINAAGEAFGWNHIEVIQRADWTEIDVPVRLP